MVHSQCIIFILLIGPRQSNRPLIGNGIPLLLCCAAFLLDCTSPWFHLLSLERPLPGTMCGFASELCHRFCFLSYHPACRCRDGAHGRAECPCHVREQTVILTSCTVGCFVICVCALHDCFLSKMIHLFISTMAPEPAQARQVQAADSFRFSSFPIDSSKVFISSACSSSLARIPSSMRRLVGSLSVR